VFLPGGSLYGGYNLPCYTELGKSAEGRKLVLPEIPYGFVKANHSLLNDVFPIGSNKK